MTYYQYAVTGWGFALVCMMSARLGVACYDSRIFLAAVRAQGYSRPRWFTFARCFVPSILGAPVILWMDPNSFFRRTPAPVIWDMAEDMLAAYGVEEDEEPGTAVRLHDDNCN